MLLYVRVLRTCSRGCTDPAFEFSFLDSYFYFVFNSALELEEEGIW